MIHILSFGTGSLGLIFKKRRRHWLGERGASSGKREGAGRRASWRERRCTQAPVVLIVVWLPLLTPHMGVEHPQILRISTNQQLVLDSFIPLDLGRESKPNLAGSEPGRNV